MIGDGDSNRHSRCSDARASIDAVTVAEPERFPLAVKVPELGSMPPRFRHSIPDR